MDNNNQITDYNGLNEKFMEIMGISDNPHNSNKDKDDEEIDLSDDSSDQVVEYTDDDIDKMVAEISQMMGVSSSGNSGNSEGRKQAPSNNNFEDNAFGETGVPLNRSSETSISKSSGQLNRNYENNSSEDEPDMSNLDILQNKMLLEKEQLHKEKQAAYKKEYNEAKKDSEQVKLTADQYVRGQKVLFGNEDSEEFKLEDYVTAVAIQENNGKMPEFIPNPKNKRLQIASFNLLNSTKTQLSPSNSIDCSDFNKLGIFKKEMPRFIYTTNFGVKKYKRDSFKNILKRAQALTKGPIKSVVFLDGSLVVNKQIVNLNGTDARIPYLVDFDILRKYAPMLSTLSMDEEIGEVYCNQNKLNMDIIDIANNVFFKFKMLEVFILDGVKLTRNNYETIIREDERAKQIQQTMKVNNTRNEFDALLKERVVKPEEVSNEDLLKAYNRRNIASPAERKFFQKGSMSRGIAAGALTVAAFGFLSFMGIADFLTFGSLTKVKKKAVAVASGVVETGKKAANLGNKIR